MGTFTPPDPSLELYSLKPQQSVRQWMVIGNDNEANYKRLLNQWSSGWALLIFAAVKTFDANTDNISNVLLCEKLEFLSAWNTKLTNISDMSTLAMLCLFCENLDYKRLSYFS